MRKNGCKKSTDEARRFLERIKKLDIVIQNKIAEKEQWESLAQSITSKLSEDKVQSSGSQQRMSEAIERAIDIEREIERLIDRLIYEKQETVRYIEQLSAIQYDVLHKMYLQNYDYYAIASKYGKTYSWATTVHGRALKNLQDLLDAEKVK